MTLVAWLVYIPLQVLWLVPGLIGAIWVGYKQIVVSRRLGVSQTAVEIINGRWTMDVFGMRPDEAARKLASTIPNNSTVGLAVALLPLWVARQIAGKPFLYPTLPPPEDAGIPNFVPSRTEEFDSLIEVNADHAEQFVVLGAGLDTRCYGSLKDRGLAMFELDQKAVQTYKLENLAKAQIETNHIEYVEVDFTKPDWIDALKQSSFDSAKKTIFLWEGVTLYLGQDDICATLAALKANSAPGSVVVVDFYSKRFIRMLGKGKTTSKLLDATGEGLDFGMDFSEDAEAELVNFTNSQGLTIGRHQFLGAANKNGPFTVIAELII